MKRVLVTGGAGFVGSHVVDELINQGYDVTVLDNLDEQVHDDEPDYLNDVAEYVWGDVRDRELLADLLESVDAVSHHASKVGVGQSMYEVEEYVDVNTLGTARMLDVIANEEIDLERFVIASSMSAYGEGEYYCGTCEEGRFPPLRDVEQLEAGEWQLLCAECDGQLDAVPTTESNPLESDSIYAISKKSQEEMCLSVGRAYDIPVVALRYFNIYGSRQALDNPYTGVCAIFSSRIKNDRPPLLFEDGEQTRDFIHVSDIARVNRLALEKDGAAGRAINIGTGEPTSITELAEELIRRYGKEDELSPDVTEEFRSGDIRHCYGDASLAAECLDFEAEVSLEEGLEELVSWGVESDATDNTDAAYSEMEEKGLIRGLTRHRR
jgi:dTDP-L-rhamnose 4-epimerase